MSDSKESHNPADRFSEYFRQRLKNHPVLPDENCWDEIETRLRKKRALSPLWFSMAIASSVLVAVFVLNYFPMGKESDRKDDSAYHEEYPAGNPVEENSNPEENGSVIELKDTVINNKENSILTIAKTTGRQSPAVSVGELGGEPFDETDTAVVDRDGNYALIQDTLVIRKGEGQQEPEMELDEIDKTGPEKPYRAFENLTAYTVPENNERHRDRKWQISAGFGSAAKLPSFDLNSADNIYYDNVESPNYWHGIGGNVGSGITEGYEERIMDIKPAIPFSVGIMVRKKWNKIWGIETGLVYTRLSTDFEVSGRMYYDATLNLHYLGIPVNLVADLWKKNRLGIYVSGGGMVEKGVRSVYKRKTHLWGNALNNEETGRISGLQWSLNGGLGLSYNFYKDINLYIEPGISYYFDCNQPISKRTEDPLNFSLRLGVRYDF